MSADIAASIQCGELQVDIHTGADTETIQAIIRALKSCCAISSIAFQHNRRLYLQSHLNSIRETDADYVGMFATRDDLHMFFRDRVRMRYCWNYTS